MTKRREDDKHDVCKLADQFLAIHQYILSVRSSYDAIIQEMGQLSKTMRAARERLLSSPEVYHKQYKIQQMYDEYREKLEVSSSGTMTPGPSIRDISAMNENEVEEEEREYHQIIETIHRNQTLQKSQEKGCIGSDEDDDDKDGKKKEEGNATGRSTVD